MRTDCEEPVRQRSENYRSLDIHGECILLRRRDAVCSRQEYNTRQRYQANPPANFRVCNIHTGVLWNGIRKFVTNPINRLWLLTLSIAGAALKDAFSDKATERIDMFTKEFVQLKGTLDTGIGIQNAFVSSRMLEKVDIIGLSASALVLFPNQ